MTLQESEFSSLESAASVLARMLAKVAQEAIAQDGYAVIAVSGGRTPELVFERLREHKLAWNKVVFTLTDERWVSNQHKDSNERLVRSLLLKGSARAAQFVPLFGGEPDPIAGLLACETRLLELRKPVDAVYLGMGADGHIASLFPNTDVVQSVGRTCVAVPEAPNRLPRLSLSLDTILSSRQAFLLYSGADKHDAYITARDSDDLSDSALASLLSQQVMPVTVLRTIH